MSEHLVYKVCDPDQLHGETACGWKYEREILSTISVPVAEDIAVVVQGNNGYVTTQRQTRYVEQKVVQFLLSRSAGHPIVALEKAANEQFERACTAEEAIRKVMQAGRQECDVLRSQIGAARLLAANAVETVLQVCMLIGWLARLRAFFSVEQNGESSRFALLETT